MTKTKTEAKTEKLESGVVSAGHRETRITAWNPYLKNSLRGFFTAILPSGLILNRLMLHESNGKRWIGLPAREWTDAQGQRQFSKLIEFVDCRTADRFRDQMLAALDAYLAENRLTDKSA